MSIKNFLIGTAIGDAFGAGVEFQDRNWIRQNVDFKSFINARHLIKVEKEKQHLFTKNYQEWDYTDDTEMTIGVGKALATRQKFTPKLVLQFLEKEYQKGKAEKGFGRNGHGSLAWYFEGRKSINEIRDFQKNRANPGNAPAVRAAILGFLKENLVNKYAKINALATHPNPIAIMASQTIARAAKFMFENKNDTARLWDYCYSTINYSPSFLTYLKEVEALPRYEELEETHFEKLCGKQPICKPYFLPNIYGMPSDAMLTTGCVLYVLKWAKTPFDALKKSILLGGDVDSLAGTTTGILATKYGLDTLPKFMLENVEGVNYLEQLASDFKQF